jgi:hypothetical protein
VAKGLGRCIGGHKDTGQFRPNGNGIASPTHARIPIASSCEPKKEGQHAHRLSITTCVANARSLAPYDGARSGSTNRVRSLFARPYPEPAKSRPGCHGAASRCCLGSAGPQPWYRSTRFNLRSIIWASALPCQAKFCTHLVPPAAGSPCRMYREAGGGNIWPGIPDRRPDQGFIDFP